MTEQGQPKLKLKDSVFVNLFRDKQYVFELYRVLHPEDGATTEDDIEIVTISNVLVNNLYNDLGFMVNDRLIMLVEAQSTWTVNIIVRTLLYLAKTYQKYISDTKQNVYNGTKIKLPEPELYVIYTGKERPVKDTISLSEEFFGGRATSLEVKVRVLTDGNENDIVYQYVAFTKVYDEQVRIHGRTKKAVEETIRICKDRNILKRYLTDHESEVLDIMVELYDQETVIRQYGESKLMEGEAKAMRQTAIKLLKEGASPDYIVRITDLPLEEVNKLKKHLA